MELKRNIIHGIPPFLECIVAYIATRLYKTGYGSVMSPLFHSKGSFAR